ncbi:hypothetical protein EV361DRAFT_880952 [Lentinula raphanica]|nr:hypothetical protein FB446DRAFT_715129 [Lentinula raphanica]KAJ3976973.1 hypothetical protein EV361DRAFT_880952 [Lentinula raphanica]
MPVSTQTFDILFELTNDMNDSVFMELVPPGGGRVMKGMGLEKGQGMSLVLVSGHTYRYTLTNHYTGRYSRMTIRAWNDISCTSSSLLGDGARLPAGITCKAGYLEYDEDST